MKIVHLCLSSFYIDNYSYQENMLPKYHALQGHDVTVIASLVSFDDNGKPCLLNAESCIYTDDGYKVVRIDYKRPFYKFNKFIRRYNKLTERLTEESPDIIFIHDFSFLDINKVIRYISKRKEVKVFVDCHTDYINSAKSYLSKHLFHHIVWRYYAYVLSPYVLRYYGTTPLRCTFLKEAYHIATEKIDLLVMGIDDKLIQSKNKRLISKDIRSKHNVLDNDFLIVSGGKIDYLKNIHLLAEAVIKMNNAKVKLLIFGTIAPEMQSMLKGLLSNEQIIFVGWLSANQILDYLLASDLICFPGTHSVLWEQSVALGIPTIFKYWRGMTHVDLGGNCRFLYNDSVDEIYTELVDIIKHPMAYNQMKTIALQEGKRVFSYSEIAKRAIEPN